MSSLLRRLLEIEAVQADPGFDVRLVPVAVYWGRAPQKEGSWLRLLLSENWVFGSSLRKLLQVIFNGRFTMLELGEPQSLRGLLEGDAPAAAQAARIARALRARFRRRRAARIGPDLSHRRTIVARVLRTRAVRAAVAQEMRDRKLDRRKALLVDGARLCRGDRGELLARLRQLHGGLLTRLWNRLYDGVEFEHVETLREVSRDGREIVFVPCHRSHMDYLLLSYAIYRQGYAIPHIAAGINLEHARRRALPAQGRRVLHPPQFRRQRALHRRLHEVPGDDHGARPFDRVLHRGRALAAPAGCCSRAPACCR
jgi:glycerol-3-phosphate O-acyltransferase